MRGLGNQTGGNQNRRIRGIGAGGDRRNNNVTIAEIIVRTINSDRFRRCTPGRIGKGAGKRCRHLWQSHTILRALWPSH